MIHEMRTEVSGCGCGRGEREPKVRYGETERGENKRRQSPPLRVPSSPSLSTTRQLAYKHTRPSTGRWVFWHDFPAKSSQLLAVLHHHHHSTITSVRRLRSYNHDAHAQVCTSSANTNEVLFFRIRELLMMTGFARHPSKSPRRISGDARVPATNYYWSVAE